MLDDSRISLPIAEADLGIPGDCRIGHDSRPVSGETCVAQTFTPASPGPWQFSLVHFEPPWHGPRMSGDTLDIRIFQLGALVGREAPNTVALALARPSDI